MPKATHAPITPVVALASDTPHTPPPHNAPGFSAALLGRQLGLAKDRQHRLDILTMQLGAEQHRDPLDRRRLERRHAKAAQVATDRHCDALEDAILSCRPETVADAAVQVLVVAARIDGFSTTNLGKEAVAELETLSAVLTGILRVVAGAGGVTLAEVGGRHYTSSTWNDPWPALDLSAVAPDCREDGCDVCIDGSAACGGAGADEPLPTKAAA